MYPIFKQKYTYTYNKKSSIFPTNITYQVLSKKELSNLKSQYPKQNTFKAEVVLASTKNSNLVNELSEKQFNELFTNILKLSEIDTETVTKIKQLFTLSNAKELQSETWDCSNCKERGLQESRNCPYLKQKTDFEFFLSGELYTYCPVYDIEENKELFYSSMYSYSMFSKKLLPEDGGLFDQTDFFITSSFTIDSLIKELEAKEYKRLNKE